MRILTLNCNGIRSAARKGLFEWLPSQSPDVVCLQETKAQVHQLEGGSFRPDGFHCHYYDAERKGYSGVAAFSKSKPDRVIRGFGVPEFDGEGRYLELQFGRLSVVSLYLPSGSSGPERQASKFRFLKNWRSNQKNSGFLPEERAWLDRLFGELGWVDAFREVDSRPEQYTWWSNRGQARANNVGWRIDYQVVSGSLAGKARAASIYRDTWFSDHAPLMMDYEF
jgi:exodeoxyribonuclease-3